MASISSKGSSITVELSAFERRILQRPNLKFDKVRIKDIVIESHVDKKNLGKRISKRPFLGGVLGEYRLGSKTIIALGRLRAGGR